MAPSGDFVQLINEVDDNTPAHEPEELPVTETPPSAEEILWFRRLLGLSSLSLPLGNSKKFCFSQHESIGLCTKEMTVGVQNEQGQEVIRVTHTFTRKEHRYYVIVRTVTTYFSHTIFCDQRGMIVLQSKKYPDGAIRLFCGELVLGSIHGLFCPCGDVTIRDFSGQPKFRIRHPSCFSGGGQTYQIFDERTKIQVGQLSKGHNGQEFFALEFEPGFDMDIRDKGLILAAAFFVYTRFHAHNCFTCCAGTLGYSCTKTLLILLVIFVIFGVIFGIHTMQNQGY